MQKKNDLKAMATAAKQRSNIYGLLAVIFREEATAPLIRQFKSSQFKEALCELGVHLKDDFFNVREEKLIEDLVIEYSRLFLGPGKHISPHESVHLKEEDGGGLLWGEATAKVKNFIESSGVEYRSDYNGMPDHIGVELEFMQEVVGQEAGAWEEKDVERALYCRKVEKEFIGKHLVPWVPLFCKRVIKDAELSFYREIAKLTDSFIEFDRTEVERWKSLQ